MNATFFNAGVKTINAAYAVKAQAEVVALSTKRLATTYSSVVVTTTKVGTEETKNCVLSFIEGIKHARAMKGTKTLVIASKV